MEADRVYNFNPGPATLPLEVLKEAQAEFLNFDHSGMSILEISHRAKQYDAVHQKAKADIKELMGLGDDYEVLFCQGGASQQFAMIPLNYASKEHPGSYVLSGSFAEKAYKEAEHLGVGEIVASSKETGYHHVPQQSELKIDPNAAYVHVCYNNTIYGTEYHEDLSSPVPLIADMSSDILSRPVDVTKYAMIYGGAQKNVGPAGVTFVIIRKDLIGSSERPLQTMVNYATHYPEEARNHSMFNTPPVLPIFVMHETLKWVKAQGGVEAMYKINKKKAETLYNEIDRNSMFVGTAVKEDRSMMNVCFVMAPGHEDLEAEFMAFAKEKGMVGIKGHRSVGGFRASIYNACPQESVDALVACMQEFEKNHKK
mgnify:CR=1 FL=1